MCELCCIHREVLEKVRLTLGFEEWARLTQTESKQERCFYKEGSEKNKLKVRRQCEAFGVEWFRVTGVGRQRAIWEGHIRVTACLTRR